MHARKAARGAAEMAAMKFRLVFGDKHKIRTILLAGRPHYCVRDAGVMIGFGAKGGNLSRDVRGKYKHIFAEDRDYTELSRAIYMPAGALYALLGLVMQDQPKWAPAVARFIQRFAAMAQPVNPQSRKR